MLCAGTLSEVEAKTLEQRLGAAQPDRRRRGTRDAILGRAVALARSEGLEGLTIGRLATEMGMSKSGLFRHFGSKEELQIATIDAAARVYAERIVAPALEAPAGAERLRVLCERYFEHLEEQTRSGGCFWAASAAEFDDRPGAVRDRVRDAVETWLALLEREAAEAGIGDPAQFAFEFYSLTLGANQRSQLSGDGAAHGRARLAVERLIAAR